MRKFNTRVSRSQGLAWHMAVIACTHISRLHQLHESRDGAIDLDNVVSAHSDPHLHLKTVYFAHLQRPRGHLQRGA